MKASCGMLTIPKAFIRFLPSFCFSSNLRLRVMPPTPPGRNERFTFIVDTMAGL